jgi:hypothetical protein
MIYLTWDVIFFYRYEYSHRKARPYSADSDCPSLTKDVLHNSASLFPNLHTDMSTVSMKLECIRRHERTAMTTLDEEALELVL